MVMGPLRAAAGVVIVGAGTLAVDRHHLWTAEGKEAARQLCRREMGQK
jgi:hypothetical protein